MLNSKTSEPIDLAFGVDSCSDSWIKNSSHFLGEDFNDYFYILGCIMGNISRACISMAYTDSLIHRMIITCTLMKSSKHWPSQTIPTMMFCHWAKNHVTSLICAYLILANLWMLEYWLLVDVGTYRTKKFRGWAQCHAPHQYAHT